VTLFTRNRWAILSLAFVLSGCDPLSLASLFDSPAAGTSVLTLLENDGRELEMGDAVQGALSASDYVGVNGSYLEAWSLEGREGQTVTIDLVSDAFDSYLYVVGPGLSEALRDDDSGGACHSRIELTFLESGDFQVVASSSGTRQSGTYQLRVSEDPGPGVAMSCGGINGFTLTSLSTAGRTISRGETAAGYLAFGEPSIENDRPVQAWSLSGVQGETVTIRLESDDYDAYLYFFGPGLTETLTDDDSAGDLDSELTVTFTQSGTFTIGAGALSSGSTGSYTLTITEPIDLATLSTDGRQIRLGFDYMGTLLDSDPVVEGRPLQSWAFEATAGQSVTIDLMSDDIDSYLQLVGPGLPLMTNDDGGDGLNSRLDVSIPQDGVYRVIASSLGGSTGSYTLRMR